MEEASQKTPDVLDDLVDADWASRYGRPVRLPSHPSHPVTRLEQARADGRQLLQILPPHGRGPRAEALRQIMVQNFLVDARGVLRPRTEKDGRPKGAVRIVSPYDHDARQAIRGNTRWSGYLIHVTETCDANARVNLITDIATTSPIRDAQALPGIHTRLRGRRLLPAQHLVDGGYISAALLNDSTLHHQVQLVGPVKASGAWQKKEQTGFTRDDFTIDFDRRQVSAYDHSNEYRDTNRRTDGPSRTLRLGDLGVQVDGAGRRSTFRPCRTGRPWRPVRGRARH